MILQANKYFFKDISEYGRYQVHNFRVVDDTLVPLVTIAKSGDRLSCVPVERFQYAPLRRHASAIVPLPLPYVQVYPVQVYSCTPGLDARSTFNRAPAGEYSKLAVGTAP